MNTAIVTKVGSSPQLTTEPLDSTPQPDHAALGMSETKANVTEKSLPAPVMSNQVAKSLLKHSLQLAVDNLFDNGTVEELLISSMQ